MGVRAEAGILEEMEELEVETGMTKIF